MQVRYHSNMLLPFWAIQAAFGYLGQGTFLVGGSQLENVGISYRENFTSALNLAGDQIPQRSLRQIPLPNKKKANNPRKKWV